jgi:Ca2+:H+ antiporter
MNPTQTGKSNYLEGSLCVCVYIIVAVCAWYYPNQSEESLTGGSEISAAGAEHFFGGMRR